jgi:hypothetical protein
MGKAAGSINHQKVFPGRGLKDGALGFQKSG